jgi:glycerol uptake facilitator-like aquaporin
LSFAIVFGTFALIFVGIGAIKTAGHDVLAVIANFWKSHYVYWIGPLLGAAAAGLVYRLFTFEKKTNPVTQSVV